MVTAPLISIVTVCLNSAAHIERCINSVLNQTYPNIEYIIIDGGSTDGTLDIIRKYEERITYWVSENDQGIYDAMNKGIALCKGEFIGLLNSDDYYACDAIQVVVDSIICESAVDVIHANIVMTYDDGNVFRKYSHGNLLKKMIISHPSCFISSEIYRSYQYDISIKISADYDLLLKLMMDGKKFRHIDNFITYFCPYGASSEPLWPVVIERYRIRLKYSNAIAIVSLFKESLLHLDELYNFHSKKKSIFFKNRYLHDFFLCMKKIIRPLFLLIKRQL